MDAEKGEVTPLQGSHLTFWLQSTQFRYIPACAVRRTSTFISNTFSFIVDHHKMPPEDRFAEANSLGTLFT